MSKQLALPLDIPEDLLRKAHKQCRCKTEFEEAMKLEHFRISLRRVAMLIAARSSGKKKQPATH